MTALPLPEIASGTPSSIGWRSLLRRPLAVASLACLMLIVLACVLAPLLTPYGPLSQDLAQIGKLPSTAHWLGTDTLGRDILSRLLYGGRPALLGALVATTVFSLLGITFGLLAGISERALDRTISVVVDIMMSLPGLVIMFAVLALFGGSSNAAMVTLGIFASAGLVRVVRAETKAAREELYVAAARVSGLGTARILARHIAPHIIGPIIVQVSLFAGMALVVQSGLAFLGLGITAPDPSWGGMIGEASKVLQQFPWLLIPSGTTIAICVLALGLLGDAVRDATAAYSPSASPRRRRFSRQRPGAHARSDAGSLLGVDSLSVSFHHGDGSASHVVRDLTFHVDVSEIVGLVGESGSGKTLTALALLGLAPGTASATAQSLHFDTTDLTSMRVDGFQRIRGTGIGLISQEPMMALDPSFTVGHILKSVLRKQLGLRGKAVNAQMLALLSDVRLPDPNAIARRYPHELSGGMAQRVAIAIALAGEPKLLIADEPTTALDVTVQAEILDLLRALRDEKDMAILIVTHDLGVVADICERVIVLKNGTIVEQQDVYDLFARPESDYTRSLMDATPSLIDLDAARREMNLTSKGRNQ